MTLCTPGQRGFGTRISEESSVRPKPMTEIGHRPIRWHIMKIYAAADLTDFIICCGYRGHLIKEYCRAGLLPRRDFARWVMTLTSKVPRCWSTSDPTTLIPVNTLASIL